MTRLRRRFGFWGALGNLRIRSLFFSPEFLGALTIGGGGSFWLVRSTTIDERVVIAGDALVLSGALVGIMFAGFALVVGLLSDSYLRWLEETDAGIEGFYSPFLVGIGIQVGALLAALSYRAAAIHLSREMERWGFRLLAFLIVFAILDVVALARDVFAHGVARAQGVRIDELRKRKSDRNLG